MEAEKFDDTMEYRYFLEDGDVAYLLVPSVYRIPEHEFSPTGESPDNFEFVFRNHPVFVDEKGRSYIQDTCWNLSKQLGFDRVNDMINDGFIVPAEEGDNNGST